ncbi:unnamed protein product [Cylindrotheca closterium]|uniref:Uncharacterized protein n=1 Tax=Cylindrotheca closterium TaxID=2856 RepID=A0AAD2CI32_9STRA|nr:unnamed protein product [Cylindrotheca closterium]
MIKVNVPGINFLKLLKLSYLVVPTNLCRTSEMNEEPIHDKLLAHVTKHSSLQPGELQRVMSDKLALVPATKHRKGKQEAKNHKIVIDGVRYKACATTITYSVLRVSTRKNLALVDRGANGGIAGDDVRIIVKTNVLLMCKALTIIK